MANPLMFEVGVSNSVKNLDNVKKLLDDLINEYSKGKAIKLRIEIDNLKTITDALSQIGDSSQLRNLRQEIEALNREFAKLAVGAGGKGDMGVRGMNQEVEELKGKWESAIRLLTRYNEELDLARRNRDATSNPIDRQGYTDQINKLKEQIKEQQGFVKSAKQAYDDAVASAGKVVEANAKVAASTNEANTAFEKIREETSSTKSSVDSLTNSVAELVTQLKNASSTGGMMDASKSSEKSAKSSKEAAEAKDAEAEKERKLKIEEETRLRLLKELEDQIKRIANIENSAKGLGLDTSVIGAAQKAFGEFFQTMSNEKFDPQAFRATFSRLKTEYRDVVQEADRLNKVTERSNIKQQSEEFRAIAANMKAAENEARKLTITISNLEAFANKADAIGIDTTKLRAEINDLKIYRQALENIASGRSNQNVKKFITADWFLETKRNIKEASASIKKDISNALKPDNEGANALKEYVSILRQITSLAKTANRADALGIDTQTLRNQISLLEHYAKIIEQFAHNKGAGFNAWMQSNPVYGEARGNIAADQAKMNREIADAKNTNTHVTTQLSDSEQRLANAVKGSTDSMRGQSQVLSDLKMLATQYLSVWGAQSFVGSIIETGGLLEQQRLSLSAILGDMGKAQTLFNQIKTMALKSPFGVVELDKMSKQLAAYSFEYEELFDWTKRLADISAATGTSVDRLALALGHVRSEGALSGYTLRQFAMANVPVLRMLSENLGISSKEVRERVKKKEISAEDVQDILKQLTEDGGMFANAQETMSEALNAKFKNLRDAFDIMYGEIAESGIGDKLKDIAVILTDGAKHWERLATDVKDVAIAFGIGKVAMLMYNNALGKGTAITLKSALASKQKEIANLQLTASYRKLTTEEMATMANGNRLNATNISTLLSTKKLTYAELERAVALGKVKKAEALAALDMLNMHKQMALLRQVAPLQGFARMWAIVAYNIKLAGAAVKSFLTSAWPLLALTAVFELWNRRSEQKDNARDMAKTMAGNARGREAYEMRDTLADSRKLSEEALKQNIEEMQNALIAANAYTDGLKKQVAATDDLTKKYDLLKLKINEVADAYEEQKVTQESMMNEAWDAGGGLFSDNMLEDTKQFDTAMAEYQKKLTIASKQIKSVLSEWLKNQGQFKEEFSTMTGKQIFETLTNEMQASFLNYAWNAKGLDDVTSEMLREISRAYSKVGDKLSEMRGEQGEEFASTMKAMYEEAFKVDLDKASDEQKIAFDKWLRETLARAEDLSNDAKEALRNIVIDFTIKLVPHYVVDKPQTAQDVIDQQIGDNKWLSGFFGRQNNKNTTGVWTVETAQKEVRKYKKLFGDISLSNLDTAPKKLNSLLDGLEETKMNLQNTLSNGLLSQEEKDAIQKSLDETTESIDLANKALSDVGGKRKKKGGSKGGGSKNLDTERAKAVREQVRVIKEAADAYQYWRDKVGDKAAWEHVESEFGDILHKIGITADNIDDVRGRLKTIPLMKEYREIKDQKVKTEIDKEIAKEEDQYKRKDFERETEKFLSETQIKLDSLTRSWEKFNTVREATGDIKLAFNISGVKYQEGERTLADAVRHSLEEDFKTFGVQPIEFSIELDKDSVKRQIQNAFAEVAPVMPKRGTGESDESFKQRIDAYNQALVTYEAHIKGVVTEYEKWQDLQKEVEKKDISIFLKALEDNYDREQQLSKVIAKYEDEKRSLDNLLRQWEYGIVDEKGNRKGITQEQYERAFANLTNRSNWNKFKAENDFNWVFDNISTTNLETLRKMVKAMGEYAKTTKMSAEETRAWQEAMDKLTDQENVLNPLKTIADTVTDYNTAVSKRKAAEDALRISQMSRVERKRNGIDESTVVPLQEALDDYKQALSNEERALLRVTKAINTFANKISELGSSLSSLGSTIGGEFGDIMNGVGGMLGDLGNTMKSASQLGEAMKTKGISGTVGKVSAVIGIIDSVVAFNQKLDSILPSTESIYEKYAEKQRKINELQEQIADYQLAALERQIQSTNWLYNEGLSELRNQGHVKENLLKEYANTMLRPQEIYQEARSGLSKWGPAIVGAIVGIVVGVCTYGLGSIGGVALGSAISAALGGTVTAVVGGALAAGAGAAVGTALRSAADQFMYDSNHISARENLRVMTQTGSFWRGEKTENLEDWVREKYGKELFDASNYDLIDIELAKSILESGINLAGETRATLERLVEYAEKIRELEDNVKEYVSQMFAPLVDNMTDALWDWLATGRDVLDSFEEYASDTFKNIAQDAVKSFLKINLIDKYQEKLNKIFTAYSLGAPIVDNNGNVVGTWDEQALGMAVASVAGEIRDSYEALAPSLEMLGETLRNAFDYQGYDIVNGGSGSSSSMSNTIKGVTEQTADLIASYLNACRADLSVNRAMIAQYFPMFYQALTSSNGNLVSIENHTAAIMRSNERIAEKVSSLDDRISGLQSRTWKMPIA